MRYLDVTIRLTRQDQMDAPTGGLSQAYLRQLAVSRGLHLDQAYEWWRDPVTGDVVLHQVYEGDDGERT